jgi:gluconate 2-dehydrogenase gamma chain
MHLPSRRHVLFGAGSAGLTAALVVPLGRSRPRAAATPSSSSIALPESLRVLTVAEFFALAAACERIFPRDELPGAIDLGVPQYVDKTLGTRPGPTWTEGMRAGLARLDAEAAKRFSMPFYRAQPADQDALLTDWEADIEAENVDFLRNLVMATLEGALGDPTYGGNVGSQGWTSFSLRPDNFAPVMVRR